MGTDKLQQRIVVHVGFGKTGTTTLQRYVLPKLANEININYNENYAKIKEIMQLSHDRTVEINQFPEIWKDLCDETYLFSAESLHGWDPNDWERCCAINKRIFGEDSTIIITIRDPRSYLRSIYQQLIHGKVIKKPEEYFLRDEIYLKLYRHLNCEDFFRIDKFVLQDLVEMYSNSFKNVYVIPIEELKNLNFLTKIFSLNKHVSEQLCNIFSNSPRANIAYSDLSMRLTFQRENFLKNLTLKSLSNIENKVNNFIAESLLDKQSINKTEHTEIKKEKGYKKLQRFLFRGVLRRFFGLFEWRLLMQKIINKFFPYKKYNLPTDILPDQKTNIEYYDMIRKNSSINGYWYLEKK
jgi:hypothetical protein